MSYLGITEEKFRKIIPIGEVQKYEGNCWATTMSMMLRCHGFDISQKYVTDLFFEWRFDGINSEQMSQLVGYFNKNLLGKMSWVMKESDNWQPMMPYLEQFAPVQVFIEKHFILVIGYDENAKKITYFDPWNGSIIEVPQATLIGYGKGETEKPNE